MQERAIAGYILRVSGEKVYNTAKENAQEEEKR